MTPRPDPTLPPPGVIVSIMPTPTSPWQGLPDIARLAEAAERGGAVAVKVDGPAATRAVRRATSLPVLAVHIADVGGRWVITPTAEHAEALLAAGADIVELEADSAARASVGQDAGALVGAVCRLGAPVKVGVGTVADGLTAEAAGAAVVGSSTRGYAGSTPTGAPPPDLDLVAALASRLHVPVSAERGFGSPQVARQAFALGARYVVVGSAITDPVHLTRTFADAVPRVGGGVPD